MLLPGNVGSRVSIHHCKLEHSHPTNLHFVESNYAIGVVGTAHLSGLVHKYPEVVKVLAAYNAGESRVEKWSSKTGASDPELFTERIPFVETRDYVRTVLRNRAYYQALYSW